jgi:hypothetical protein
MIPLTISPKPQRGLKALGDLSGLVNVQTEAAPQYWKNESKTGEFPGF